LFSGLESFDLEWLKSVNKLQNTHIEQIEMVRKCLEHGIVFLYGTMLDVTRRHLADLRREIDFIIDHPGITLPSYLSIIVPILGTPVFYECLEAGSILPLTKLRDLESTTLCVKPLDPVDEVTKFIYDIQTLQGYKRRAMQHSWKFFKRYRSCLSNFQRSWSPIFIEIIVLQEKVGSYKGDKIMDSAKLIDVVAPGRLFKWEGT